MKVDNKLELSCKAADTSIVAWSLDLKCKAIPGFEAADRGSWCPPVNVYNEPAEPGQMDGGGLAWSARWTQDCLRESLVQGCDQQHCLVRRLLFYLKG